MNFLKKFENTINTPKYKIGDYVYANHPDTDKLTVMLIDDIVSWEHNNRWLNQYEGIMDGYSILDEDGDVNKVFVMDDTIDRKLTPEEVTRYLLRKKVKGYNLSFNESVEEPFTIYKEGDYVLIDSRSKYIPGKITGIKYSKDFMNNIINYYTFFARKEDGVVEYYTNEHIKNKIVRYLTPEEIEKYEYKLRRNKEVKKYRLSFNESKNITKEYNVGDYVLITDEREKRSNISKPGIYNQVLKVNSKMPIHSNNEFDVEGYHYKTNKLTRLNGLVSSFHIVRKLTPIEIVKYKAKKYNL